MLKILTSPHYKILTPFNAHKHACVFTPIKVHTDPISMSNYEEPSRQIMMLTK
jgi:hypothetical protein